MIKIVHLQRWTKHFLVALSALHVVVAAAQQDFAPSVQMRLQQQLEASLTTSGSFGASVAVRLNGKQWLGVAGVSTLTVPVETSMAFGIASITKLLAATCAMRSVEEGILVLDQTVESIVGVLPNVPDDVTIRDLLMHTSGLGDYSETEQYRTTVANTPERVWMLQDLLALIPAKRLPAGGTFEYTNTNYLLVAAVLERLYNQPFAAIVRERILEPSGAQTSWMGGSEVERAPIAARWIADRSGENIPIAAVMSGASAAGGMMCTAEDLGAIIETVFTGQIVRLETIDSMLPPEGEVYGKGLMNLSVIRGGAYGHTGSIRGYTSVAVHVPEQQATIVVLCNRNTADPRFIARDLMSVLYSDVVSVPSQDFTHSVVDAPFQPSESVRVFDYLGRETGMLVATADGNVDIGVVPAGLYMLQGASGLKVIWHDGQNPFGNPFKRSR